MTETKQPETKQTIEQLQSRHKGLERQKTILETQRQTTEERLSELRQEAKSAYGTDDLGELEQKLVEMKKENERRRAEYQEHLDKIEADLQQVEKDFENKSDSGQDLPAEAEA